VRAYALVDLRRITLYPTKDSRVIYLESALFHHLFDVTVRKLIATVPTNAQKDDGRLEVTPLERGLILFQEYGPERILDELTGGL
jgi:hypothetical protein